MSVATPPPNEPVVDEERKANEVWYRYLTQNTNAVNSATSGVTSALSAAASALSVANAASTATTFAKTILATTTASQVRTILGIGAESTFGSWTPGILVGTTAVDSYTLQAGRFVRYGRTVNVWGTVTATSISGTTGTISISGLPVKASSTPAGIKFAGAVDNISGFALVTSLQQIGCYISTGSSVVTMTQVGQSAGAVALLNSGLLTTPYSISVAVAYETTV